MCFLKNTKSQLLNSIFIKLPTCPVLLTTNDLRVPLYDPHMRAKHTTRRRMENPMAVKSLFLETCLSL